MKNRCSNPSYSLFHRYGGRGIRVCDKWRESFGEFLADVGPRPSPKHSIERINNDGGYEPGNVRWATSREQCNNTRRNIIVRHEGRQMSMADFANSVGLGYTTLLSRRHRRGLVGKVIDGSDLL